LKRAAHTCPASLLRPLGNASGVEIFSLR
jgi:hypothetical protein